jgi:hypothetical protein
MAEIQQNSSNTETNAQQHNSATTHTHKVQLLHAVIGAHRVCDGTRAVDADVIVSL